MQELEVFQRDFLEMGFEFAAQVEMNSHAAETLKTRALYYFLKNKGNKKEYYDYLKGTITLEEILEDNAEFEDIYRNLKNRRVFHSKISSSSSNFSHSRLSNRSSIS